MGCADDAPQAPAPVEAGIDTESRPGHGDAATSSSDPAPATPAAPCNFTGYQVSEHVGTYDDGLLDGFQAIDSWEVRSIGGVQEDVADLTIYNDLDTPDSVPRGSQLTLQLTQAHSSDTCGFCVTGARRIAGIFVYFGVVAGQATVMTPLSRGDMTVELKNVRMVELDDGTSPDPLSWCIPQASFKVSLGGLSCQTPGTTRCIRNRVAVCQSDRTLALQEDCDATQRLCGVVSGVASCQP